VIEPPGELSRLTAALGEVGRAPTDAAREAVYHDRIAAAVPDEAMLNDARLEDGEPFATLEPDATVYRS
jgi:hypothetical protein